MPRGVINEIGHPHTKGTFDPVPGRAARPTIVDAAGAVAPERRRVQDVHGTQEGVPSRGLRRIDNPELKRSVSPGCTVKRCPPKPDNRYGTTRTNARQPTTTTTTGAIPPVKSGRRPKRHDHGHATRQRRIRDH